MKTTAVALLFLMLTIAGFAEEKKSTAKERELIEATYRLRVKDVQRLLAEGADVNMRYGKHKADEAFQDPWDLGYEMAYPSWTPLLALTERVFGRVRLGGLRTPKRILSIDFRRQRKSLRKNWRRGES